jgi:hypothetical protein
MVWLKRHKTNSMEMVYGLVESLCSSNFSRESQQMLDELTVSGNRAEQGHVYGVVGLALAAASFAVVACIVCRCYLRRKDSRRRAPHHRHEFAEVEDDTESTV